MQTHSSYLLLILSRTKFLFGIGFLVAILAVVVTLFFPLRYSATSSMFVIPRQGFGVDPYTVIKSAERVGQNLTDVVGTSAFLEQTLQSEPAIDRSVFPDDQHQLDRRKFWKKIVEASVVPNSGLVEVTAYSTDPHQAEIIAAAVVKTLMDSGTQYVGPQVSFRIADTPVASRFPVKPNLIMNAIIGFLFGIIAAAVFILFTPKSRTA